MMWLQRCKWREKLLHEIGCPLNWGGKRIGIESVELGARGIEAARGELDVRAGR